MSMLINVFAWGPVVNTFWASVLWSFDVYESVVGEQLAKHDMFDVIDLWACREMLVVVVLMCYVAGACRGAWVGSLFFLMWR